MSESQDIVGAVALYGSPDDLLAGVSRARRLGFQRLDAVSPYPLHGIDDALGKSPSRLGYIALVAGLSAVAVAKLTQWWMSSADYPLNIGGKPLFSWPAFVPVTFELMVLFASVATVAGMLAVLNRLPRYGSGLLRSRLMPELTCDHFGLVVDGRDPKFHPDTIRDVLGEGAALDVDVLTREQVRGSGRVFPLRFLVLLAAVAAVCATGTRLVWRYGGEVPPFDFMKAQQKLNPQGRWVVGAGEPGMRLPVAGTVARGLVPYSYGDEPEQAAAGLGNPVPLTASSLERGQDRYRVFCQPCHGLRAAGDGTLTSAFPTAPSLHSSKVREWTDGRLFHVLTAGQNAMPAYHSQLSVGDRWRLVHFVRALQRSRNALEQDLP